MEIYLVGGAVRDTILRYPFHEKDWVVVGASPQAMLAAGYKPVGKDFPVFLHPETGEEYALARQERKTAPGYGGFEFNTSPDVSLEEDLLRRDLTINAMAMTPSGELIDPFGGSEDLAKKVLRHVSPAFSEDPVRVLRLARFAARYAHLGFTIASETYELAIAMVERGEVDHLVAERVWKELQAALGTRSPQVFIETLRKAGALKKIMPELDQLFGVPQPQQHHPEIDCGIHSLLTLARATQLSEDRQLRFAALVHDLGKGSTSENILPHHYGHEERGVALINTLCKRLSAPNNYRELATLVCRYHTHCHRAFELNATTLLKTLEALDALRRPDRFELFCLTCQADAQGRTGFESRPYPQADYFRKALSEIQSVEPRELVAQGFKGGELGKALRNLRIEKLQSLKQAQMSEQ